MLFASGFLAAHSVASGWISLVAGPRSKAYASSLYLLFYYTGSSLIGWTGGVFLSHLGWGGVISMICVILICSILLVAGVNRSLRMEQGAAGIESSPGKIWVVHFENRERKEKD